MFQLMNTLRQASLTADMVCFARALEHLRPPEARVVDDPYAHLFLHRPSRLLLRAAARAPATLEALRASTLRLDMAAVITARHRWIDDQLLAALPHVGQILILGAGYDSRAWRLRGPLQDRLLVELDHPATAARKALLSQAAGLEPAPSLTADLASESLSEVLEGSALDPSVPTFVVWEGVSMYLPREAVETTLRALAAWLAPGSQICADLWIPTAGLVGLGVATGRLSLRVLGEPLRFQIDPAEVAHLFSACGWILTSQSSAHEVAARFGEGAPPVLGLALGRIAEERPC